MRLIEVLRAQLTALASTFGSDGIGFKPPERCKGSGGKPGGQPRHPGYRLVCPFCSTGTCATLPADVEVSQCRPAAQIKDAPAGCAAMPLAG